jgi:hypothetical protein
VVSKQASNHGWPHSTAFWRVMMVALSLLIARINCAV